jgi:hypothetical protein
MFDRPPLLEEPFAQTLSGKIFQKLNIFVGDVLHHPEFATSVATGCPYYALKYP